MGIWEASLADLRSIGIEVSYAQRDVMARGGEVLVIQHLPEAGSNYCQCGGHHPQFDADGNRVMVAAIMQTFPVSEPSVEFHRPPGVVTYGDLLDLEEYEQWRFWPSVVGKYETLIDSLSFYEAEEAPVVRRIWDTIPVAEIGRYVADAVVAACDSRVGRTVYDLVDQMNGYQESGEYYPLSERGSRYADEHYFTIVDGLIAAGWWSAEEDDWTTAANELIDFPPMSELLVHDPVTLRVWEDLERGSSLGASRALATIRKGERNLYMHREGAYEPWF